MIDGLPKKISRENLRAFLRREAPVSGTLGHELFWVRQLCNHARMAGQLLHESLIILCSYDERNVE